MALQHMLADTKLVVGRHPDPWVVWQDVGLLQVGQGEMAAPERLPLHTWQPERMKNKILHWLHTHTSR